MLNHEETKREQNMTAKADEKLSKVLHNQAKVKRCLTFLEDGLQGR
jgi:hypothetical protein